MPDNRATRVNGGPRLLSVDWDFFTITDGQKDVERSMLCDWGCGEGFYPPAVVDGLWRMRAAMFDARGVERPGLSDDLAPFWARFNIAPHARLFVADSHAYGCADELRRANYREIVSFDAHHDLGYHAGDIAAIRVGRAPHCGNWLLDWSFSGADVRVRYPRWKVHAMAEARPTMFYRPARGLVMTRRFDDGKRMREAFDDVLVVRSGGWAPPWLDPQFEAFTAACPAARNRVDLEPTPRRPWREDLVDDLVGELRKATR